MNQLNEVRRFQKIAGLLKEDEVNQIVDKVEGSVEAKLDQLTPQQIQQLQADLAKMGITADTSVEDAAEKIEGSLDEAEGDDRKKLANALSAIGTGLIGSLLVPFIPLAIGQGTGIGTAGGYAVTFAAGGLLVGLAKALQHKGNSKMEDYHPDDPAGSDSAAARGEDDYEGEEEDALVRVIKFKKNNQDLGMFLNWLESYYTEAQTSDISTWDTDESFYFDPATLTLVLYNEEFDMEGNQEFHDYLQGLKSNILSIKS